MAATEFVGCKSAMSVVGVSARGQVPPFYVMRILEAVAHRRASGLPVYDLTAGQPSTPAPAQVRAEAHHVLDADRIGYTGALGLPVLRHAIAQGLKPIVAIQMATLNAAQHFGLDREIGSIDRKSVV